MAKLIFNAAGQRFYETGVSETVLYNKDANGTYPKGVAWNGIIGITENPTGAEPTPLYADNIKYLDLQSAEEFVATIEAYTYPEEFGICDGSKDASEGVSVKQQAHSAFGLAYKTKIGNDVNDSLGYKLHLIYGAVAAPASKAYKSINKTPDGITFSWNVTTTPEIIEGFKPSANIVIDSTKVDPTKLESLIGTLYGTAEAEPNLPLPSAVIALLN